MVRLVATGLAMLAAVFMIGGVVALESPGTVNDVRDLFDRGGDSSDEVPRYDATMQIDLEATLLGDASLRDFEYSTRRSCTFCFNLAGSDAFAITGVDDVTVRHTLRQDGDLLAAETQVVPSGFLEEGSEIPGGGQHTFVFTVKNLEAGDYQYRAHASWDPSVANIFSNEDVFETTITVPKEGS